MYSSFFTPYLLFLIFFVIYSIMEDTNIRDALNTPPSWLKESEGSISYLVNEIRSLKEHIVDMSLEITTIKNDISTIKTNIVHLKDNASKATASEAASSGQATG